MNQSLAEDAAPGRFKAFSHMSFRRYWLARFLATFSVQIVSVAVGWQVYDLTRNPLDLGIVGLVQFLPSLILVLVTGSIADRFGRRMIMGLSTLLECICALLLLYITLVGVHSVTHIFAILAIFGVARAFFSPASAALLANLVPARDFANAVAWNSSSWQFAAIGGPVAGGLLYGISPQAAYGTAVFLIGISALVCFIIPKPRQHSEVQKVSLNTLFEGFRYIYREKVVFGAISLDLFAVLLGGAVALLPVYARDILELGPWALGLLRASPGIGALLTAIWLSGSPFRDHAGIIMLFFVGMFGVFTVIFGISTVPWLSILALSLMGAADMVSVYIRETLIQLWTPDRLRGRVNAVNMVFVGASNELGEFRAGTMAALIGTVNAVVFGGVGAVGIAIIWAWLFPQLRRVRHLSGRD
jgi:MFS family permease